MEDCRVTNLPSCHVIVIEFEGRTVMLGVRAAVEYFNKLYARSNWYEIDI